KELNIEHKYSKVSDKITLSIGICSEFSKKEDISEAIIKADRVLYKSKERGRNIYTKVNFNSSKE
ncbi:MAG: diguanylate cyclase domain-containing protein, partial [Paraclostridium sp.]